MSCNPGDSHAAVDKLNRDLERTALLSKSNALVLNSNKSKYFGSRKQTAKIKCHRITLAVRIAHRRCS